MPKGKGTYGSKKGRPPKRKKKAKSNTGWLVQKNDIGDRTAGTLQKSKKSRTKKKRKKK